MSTTAKERFDQMMERCENLLRASAGRVVVWVGVCLFSAVGLAAESISITATPRYPWNGKVDLKFTIDGTSGTKYDTSFTAKDVAGGTNLTMKTLYKSNGTAANVAKEQLLPGTYNWVWDAGADLTSRWPSYAGCVPTSSAVLFKDAQLAAIEDFYAVLCGAAIKGGKTNPVKGKWIKADGTGKSVQFTYSADDYTKCVCVHFEQSGVDVVGYVKWARYVDGSGHDREDFDANSATTMTIATSETASGYGACELKARVTQPDASVVLDRVVVEGKTQLPDSEAKKYMILDLGTGAISYLTSVPSGGWGSTYKSTKVALRYCEPGQFKMQGSRLVHISKPFYIGVFEMTEKQIAKICGSFFAYSLRDKSAEFATECACGCISYNTARGSSNGAKWPSSSSVDSSSVIGKIRAKAKLNFDLPTEAQWEYACRAGTTTSYNDGSNASSALNALAWYGMSSAERIANGVGQKNANAWGLYDMHGNVSELVLDWYASIGTVEVTDPKGPTSGSKRVCRGGEFWSSASACTSSSRTSVSPNTGTYNWPDYTNDAVGQGFRLCLTLE